MKNRIMKTIIAIVAAVSISLTASAHGFHHHHHHHGWGRYGWIGPAAFGTGLLIGSAIAPTPVVVAPQVPNRVWVPGCYVTEYDAYGRPFSRWIPGHWEYR